MNKRIFYIFACAILSQVDGNEIFEIRLGYMLSSEVLPVVRDATFFPIIPQTGAAMNIAIDDFKREIKEAGSNITYNIRSVNL